jgi:hypothetical protein
VQIQTISILQEQRRTSTAQHYHSSSPQLPVEQSSLLQLAESMVETGEVPAPDIDYSASDSSSVSSSRVATSPEIQLNSERGQASSVLRIPPTNSGTTGSLSSQESMDLQIGWPNRLRSPQLEVLDPDSPVVELAASANSVEIERNDYLAVRSADSILHLNADRHIQAETGNIMTPRSKRTSVTVIVDSELEANIVSETFAVENGLEIQDAEDDASVIVEYEPGVRMRSVGQVVLVWTKDFSHRQPLRVHCWVVPYSGRPIYFGKPFIVKREYYWAGGQQNS